MSLDPGRAFAGKMQPFPLYSVWPLEFGYNAESKAVFACGTHNRMCWTLNKTSGTHPAMMQPQTTSIP